MENEVSKEKKPLELEDQQLDKVVGGAYETRSFGGLTFTGHVDKYHGIVGQNYYLTYDFDDQWFSGTLIRSYEKELTFGDTRRTHVLRIIINNGVDCSAFQFEREFNADRSTLYTEMYMDAYPGYIIKP